MAERNESEPVVENAPEGAPKGEAGGGPGAPNVAGKPCAASDSPAAHAMGGRDAAPDAPAASAQYGTGGPVPPSGPASPGRFRRWSGNPSVRIGAVCLVSGLIGGLVGGLVGGGVVAAFADDEHEPRPYVRIERGWPWGGRVYPPHGPMMRGPWWGPPCDGQPCNPVRPVPSPSPKATG